MRSFLCWKHLSLLAAVAALALGIAGTASAATSTTTTVGPVTLTNIAINGTPGTVATVAPGADVTISANWADAGLAYCSSCIDFLSVGYPGQPAAGCLENNGGMGMSGSGSVDLGPAPTAPGTYDIVAHFEEVYYCGEYWNTADSVNYQVIAQVVVPDTDGDLALSNVPSSFSVNATSPAGATVSYTAPTATDEDGPAPTVSCAPASGTTFAIGTTTVTCSATAGDTNSPVTASFTVTVNGAAAQLADLLTAVEGVGPGKSLPAKVKAIQADVARGSTKAACNDLGAFLHEVAAQTGQTLTSAQAASFTSQASSIESALGC